MGFVGCSHARSRIGFEWTLSDFIMVGTWMLHGNGWSLIWTQSWLAHGCSAGMELCGNGCSQIWTLSWLAQGCFAGMDAVRSGRYHGWHKDALREWMEFDLDVIMAGTWMLHGNGWSLIWTLSWLAHGCSAGMDGVRSGRYHGWHMDALREWMRSDLDVIMIGTWMLCGNGWSLIWTLSWFAQGCSAGMDGV